MPLHLAPVSRRSFLTHTAAAMAGLAVFRTSFADQGDKPFKLALLSDSHIPSSPDIVARNVNMTSNFKQVIRELCAQKHELAHVILNGDCAYNKGLPEDYANLASLLPPLVEAGLPLHVTMGNHDDREPLYAAISQVKPDSTPVDSKHISILETPHANLFLLDTLKIVNLVTGELGPEQLAWLDKALTERKNKPAILVTHHYPQFEPPAQAGRPWHGITDTDQLFELISRHPQVKAYIYGHSHNWSVTKRDHLHLINLPPIAYVFAPEKPNGWVEATLTPNGINLILKTISPDHPQNGETHQLNWS